MAGEYEAARMTAISFIGISHKSSGRVRAYLSNKGFGSETVQMVVSDLFEAGYIDDYRVAAALIRKRTGRQAESKSVLKRRLRAAGISESAILECEDLFVSDENSLEDLIQRKYFSDLTKKMEEEDFNPEKWFNKTARALLSKGYSQHLIFQTLHKVIHDVE